MLTLNVRLKSSSFSDDFKAFFQRFSLSAVNSEPTYCNCMFPSLLDLFLVSDISSVNSFYQISPPSFLDHDIIFLSYSFSFDTKPESKYVYYRDYAAINGSLMLSKIEQLEWSNFYQATSIDDKLSLFNDNILSIFNEFVPIKRKILKLNHYPWFCDEVKSLIAEREYLYSKSKHLKTAESKTAYKYIRNKVTSLIRKLKFNYYSRKLDPSLPPKMLWSNLRSLGVCGKDKQDCDIEPEILNDYFLNSTSSCFQDVPYRPINENCKNFSFSNVDECDVFSAIFSIKSNAMGLDGIPPQFIKLILPSILPILTDLFNYCITSSSFPSLWKKACVIPVPKKNTCTDPSDYRPISILCFLSKVLEKLMFTQIVKYLDNDNLLTSWQSGFRKFHSCETAVLKVSSDLRNFLDSGKFAAICLLDFSKAFDSVSHSLLLVKLVNYFNFSSTAISLVSNFLLSRSQKVKVKDSYSKDVPVVVGVPQGSLLGPLFFSLFINDLPLIILHCLIHLYADDVQLYLDGNYSDPSACIDKLNFDLQLIWQWAIDNGLILNPDKSQYMLIGDVSRLSHIPPTFLNGQPLPIVSKIKNLGVMLNNKMTCCDYVQSVLQKVYFGLRSLRLTSCSLPIDMRKKLIQSLIVPHFLYGSVIFPSLDSRCAMKLRVAFNDCTRYVYGLTRYSHISSFENNILGCSLSKYLIFRSLILFYKILSSSRPPYLANFIVCLNSQRRILVLIPLFKRSVGERSFFVQICRHWNDLAPIIQRASSLNSFKRLLWSSFCPSTSS